MLSAKDFGVNNRQRIRKITENHIAIEKKRKSRIIMKDALKIIALAEEIKKSKPNLKISLISTENICSKSIKALKEAGLDIIIENEEEL